MNTCETCAYWAEKPDINFKNLRACSDPEIQYGYGEIDVDDNGALIEDDEGWGIRTGPKFGCIHHLKK